MPRVACLMMQKDEAYLLRPWLLYHGYLFGFENLYVYDNGSSAQATLRVLHEFAQAGVHVDFNHTSPEDFEHKGRILGQRIKAFQDAACYDLALPLDCDEFLAVNGDDGLSCGRDLVHAELARILSGGTVCRTAFCLSNRPGYLDLFRYLGHVKSVVIVDRFIDIDHGFHQAGLPAGQTYGDTALIHIHMNYKPFAHLLQSAKNKLQPFVDVADAAALARFDGVGVHLKRFFGMTPAAYYRNVDAYDGPVIRFHGLSRLLGLLMALPELRQAWEAGRPDGLLDGVIEVDMDLVHYRGADYLRLNPDLVGVGLDAFTHFVSAGYQEGRRLDESDAGLEEIAARMARVRAQKRDGIAGYAGLALPLCRLGRGAEADRLLQAALLEFGETPALVREQALSAMYQNQPDEAARHWSRFRACFPTVAEGYLFGAMASRDAGRLAEAERIVRDGVSRFPEHTALAGVQTELAHHADHAGAAAS